MWCSLFCLSSSLAFFYRPPPPHTCTRSGCSCVHYSCEAIDCQEPLIRNAELKCSSPGRHFYNGDRCTIYCNSGYVLQVHQDDDIIKSQVNTQLNCSHMFCTHTHGQQHREAHGCMQRKHANTYVAKHLSSIWKHACKCKFMNAHNDENFCAKNGRERAEEKHGFLSALLSALILSPAKTRLRTASLRGK